VAPIICKYSDNFISKRLYVGLLVLRKKNIETSQSSNLQFVMVFILRGYMLRRSRKGKMEKSPHSKKIKLGVDFFPFFPCSRQNLSPRTNKQKRSEGLCRERSFSVNDRPDIIEVSVGLSALDLYLKKYW